MKGSLQSAVPVIVRYYCENLGMRVEFGASGAYHVPGVIGLPNMDESEDSLVMTLGFSAHESAHEKFTDGLIVDHLPADHPPFVKSFVNVLEDIRIESLMFKAHPATVADLSHVVRKLFSGKFANEDAHEAVVLHDACLFIGRAKLLNQPIADVAQTHLQALKSVFGPGRATKILALLGQVTSLPDTKATADLGYAILDVLDEEDPEDKPNQPNPQDQQQKPDGSEDETDDPNGSGGTPARPDGDAGQPRDPTGSVGAQAAPTDPSVPGTPGAQGEPGGGMKDKVLSAGSDVLGDLTSDLGDEIAARINKLRSKEGVATPATVSAAPPGDEKLAPELVMAGNAASAGIRQVLMGLIQGTQNNRVHARRQGRSIDAKRVSQLLVGDNRVFRVTEAVKSVNANLQILLDGSTSMEGEKMRKAEIATIAVLSALETIQNVTTGAMVFPRLVDRKVSVGVLKRHNQSLREAVRQNRFGIAAKGGTPLAEAIWPAAGDLLYAKGERKVLMVVTDGDPDCVEQAQEMVQRCSASGIEVFAIAFGKGVSDDKLNAVYGKNWRSLDDVNQLRDALFALVRDILTNKAAA